MWQGLGGGTKLCVLRASETGAGRKDGGWGWRARRVRSLPSETCQGFSNLSAETPEGRGEWMPLPQAGQEASTLFYPSSK